MSIFEEEGECIPCEAGETESDSLQIVFSSKKSKQIEVNDDNNNVRNFFFSIVYCALVW